MSSHPKLTSLTTTTLSLLLERQRLQSTHPTLHLTQIVANLRTLRSGVISLQDASDAGSGDDGTEALREQYERLRGMLGEEEAEKAGLTRYAFPLSHVPRVDRPLDVSLCFFPCRSTAHDNLYSIVLPEVSSPTLPATPERKHSPDPAFEPYTDEPDSEPHALDEGGILLQQRHIIQGPSPSFPPFSFGRPTRARDPQTKTHGSTICRRRFIGNIIYRSKSMTSSMYIRGCSVRWIPSWMGPRRAWRVHGDGLHVLPVGQGKTVRVMWCRFRRPANLTGC